MNDIHDVLERKRQAESRPKPGAFDRLVRLRQRRRRNQQVGAIATALVLLAVVAWASISLFHLRSSAPEPASPIDPSQTRVVRTLELPTGLSTGVAALDGSVWVGNNALPGVVRLDPETGRTIASIRTYRFPSYRLGHPLISDVIAAFGSIWTLDTNFHTVTRIDPQTNRVIARIRVANYPSDGVEAGGSLWILSVVNGSLSEIDPLTNRMVNRKQLPIVGDNGDIAGDHFELWVGLRGETIVIDAESAGIAGRIPVGRGDNPIALAGAAWVGDGRSGMVSKIDRGVYRVVQTLRVATAPGSVVVSNGVVWISDLRDPVLTAIEPTSGRVLLRRRIGRGATQMTSSSSSLYVLNQVDNTLSVVHVG